MKINDIVTQITPLQEFITNFEGEKIDPRVLTCYDCKEYENCDYADDGYNTDGDCLRIN